MKRLSGIISGPEKWTQEWYAKDAADHDTEIDDPSACKWCLLGACALAAEGKYEKIVIKNALVEAIKAVLPREPFVSIPITNDNSTWETVSQIIAKTDEILENKGFFKDAEQQ